MCQTSVLQQAVDAINAEDFSVLESLADDLEPEEFAALVAEASMSVTPPEAARALAHLPSRSAAAALSQICPVLAAEIVSSLPDEVRSAVLSQIEPELLSRLVSELPSDEAVDVLQDIDDEAAQETIGSLPEAVREDVRELFDYDEESAGGLMAREFAVLRAHYTAQEALEALRREAAEVEDLNVLYVVDQDDRFVGVVSLRDLVLAPPTASVRDLTEMHGRWFLEHEDREKVANFIVAHDLDAAPVVGADGRLLGQITLDDAAEVVQEEGTEDMLRVSGLRGEDRPFSPVVSSVGRRLPWLLINIPLATIAAAITHLFTHTISAMPEVVGFLPIVGGLAGNAAGQTVSVHVRSLATGDVVPSDLWRCVSRQSFIGFVVGLILGTLVGGMQLAWGGDAVHAAVAGIAMCANCVAACFMGAFLPLLFSKLRVDPAMGANLVTTSLTDATGYLLVLSLASLSLGLALGR